jgi:hypothetical protein
MGTHRNRREASLLAALKLSCTSEASDDVPIALRSMVWAVLRGRSVVAAVCAVAVLSPVGARASELSWDGPADCAAAEQLSFAVERALGMPLAGAGQLQFHVRVESAESTTSARLRVSSEALGEVSKERLLVAADCSKLVDTLAVAISLAIGASESPDAPATPRARAAAAPLSSRATAPVPLDTATPALPDDDPQGTELAALLSAVVDQGSLPEPAIGVSIGLELAWDRLALRALGSLFLQQDVALEGELGAELDLMFGTLQACTNVLSEASAFSLPLCLGADLGALSGVGLGIPEPRRASMPWAAPRIDAGTFWDVPHTRLRVGALLTLAAPLNRDEFVLDEIGTVHRPSRMVGRASLGLDLHL